MAQRRSSVFRQTNYHKKECITICCPPTLRIFIICASGIDLIWKLFNGGNVNYRKLSELPYHLLQLRDEKRLVEVICNFEFIQASFMALKNFDLLHYYSQAIGIFS